MGMPRCARRARSSFPALPPRHRDRHDDDDRSRDGGIRDGVGDVGGPRRPASEVARLIPSDVGREVEDTEGDEADEERGDTDRYPVLRLLRLQRLRRVVELGRRCGADSFARGPMGSELDLRHLRPPAGDKPPRYGFGGPTSGARAPALRVLASPALRMLDYLVLLLGADERDDRPYIVVRELSAEGGHSSLRVALPAQLLLGRAAAGDEPEVGAVRDVTLLAQELVVEQARHRARQALAFVAVALRAVVAVDRPAAQGCPLLAGERVRRKEVAHRPLAPDF